MNGRTLLLTLLLAAAGSFAAAAAELRGVVLVVDGKGKPISGARQSVVYFTPQGGVEPPEPPCEPYEIVTVRKDFKPHVLAVPVGATVSFPNEDPILHNAFWVSGQDIFDLGVYRKGETREATFDEPGVVKVFCNVHHSMAAYVVVVETPYYTSPGADGRFVLTGLPEGPGTLTVWHERGEAWSEEIELPATPRTIRVEATRKRVPKHLNMKRRVYPRRGKDY